MAMQNSPKPLRTVKQYRYSRTPIGKGAFGKVYLGHHVSDPHFFVAVKEITPNGEVTKSFIRSHEIDTIKYISHKNLVQLIDFELGSMVILIMEYCNGGSLDSYINNIEHLPLDSTKLRYIFKQITDAMCFLIEHKIVHRDLKPANILIRHDHTSEGMAITKIPLEDLTFKVADFGMARVFSDDEEFRTVCGTYLYMAPEVPTRSYSAKSDVWSMGVMILECLFGNRKLRELYRINQLGTRVPVNTDRALVNLIRCVLERDPQKRFDFHRIRRHVFFRNDSVSTQTTRDAVPLQLFRNNPPVTIETLQNVIKNIDSTPDGESCLDDTVVIDSEDDLDLDEVEKLRLPVEFRR